MDATFTNSLVDLFMQWNSGVEGGVLALAVVSLVMTCLKSDKIPRWFGAEATAWQAVPPAVRSFVPLILGGLTGAIEVWISGVGDVVNGFATGFMMIGGAQTVMYQGVKNTPLGGMISGLLETYAKKAAAVEPAKPVKKKRK